MMDAFFNALSGLRVATKRVETSANNIANIQTPGFKKSRVDVGDVKSGGANANATSRVNTQGPILTTSNPIDLAVTGSGFFQVSLSDGSTGFTRSGSFKIDGQGRLADSNGNPLQPPVTVPGGSTSLSIGEDGSVSALVGGQATNIGQIELASFSNPSGLSSSGNNILQSSGSSGQALTGLPGTGNFGDIISGGVEGSNVDIAEELVGQLVSKQAFSANINVIRVVDEMTGSLLDITS